MSSRRRTNGFLQVFLEGCQRNTVGVEEPRHDWSVLCLDVVDMSSLRSILCNQDSRFNYDEGGVANV